MKSFEEWVKEQGVDYSLEEMVGRNFEFEVTDDEKWNDVTVDPPQHLYGEIADVGNVNPSPRKGKGIPLESIDPINPWFKTTGGSKFYWLPEEDCWYHCESELLGKLTIKSLEN